MTSELSLKLTPVCLDQNAQLQRVIECVLKFLSSVCDILCVQKHLFL